MERNHFPKQAIGVFKSAEDLETALDQLTAAGFDQERVSVIGLTDVLRGKLAGAHSVVDVAELQKAVEKQTPIRKVEMNELRTAAIGFPAYAGAIAAGSATVMSGGLALPVIVATAAGGVGGALLGGIFTAWLNRKRADYYGEQVAHGGILLWVTLDSEDAECQVKEILPTLSIEPVRILETTETGKVEAHQASAASR